MPSFPSVLFPSVFLTKMLDSFLISSMRAVFSDHDIFLDMITIIIFREALLYALFSSLPLPPS
jgi:hypothetical protein